MPSAVAPAIVAPDTPALTAAATAAAPASAIPVSCVTLLAITVRSTRADKSAGGTAESGRVPGSITAMAMPTGATRIAAPLVVPTAPASSGGTPARMAATARLVEGPSRSSEPRSAMARSHSVSAAARSCGSILPRPLTRSLASKTACSVSSVTVPAGMPPAMG